MLELHRTFITGRLTKSLHLSLHGLKDELTSRGIAVSRHAIQEFIRRGSLTV
jgi:hypothetical protein